LTSHLIRVACDYSGCTRVRSYPPAKIREKGWDGRRRYYCKEHQGQGRSDARDPGGFQCKCGRRKDYYAKLCDSCAREASRGGKRSEETRRKMSEAQKGRELTEDHKENLSKAKYGRRRGGYSRYHSDHPLIGQTLAGLCDETCQLCLGPAHYTQVKRGEKRGFAPGVIAHINDGGWDDREENLTWFCHRCNIRWHYWLRQQLNRNRLSSAEEARARALVLRSWVGQGPRLG